MKNNELETIEEIKTPCKTPEELFQSEEFFRGIEIILKKINPENYNYISNIIKKSINKEQLNSIEKDILISVFENEDFRKYGKQVLDRLHKSKITANYDNMDDVKGFINLFKEISYNDGFDLIKDTLILSIQDSTKEILEFQKIEKFSEIGEKAKNIIKEYFPENYNENKLYKEPIFKTVINFIKYSKDYNDILKSLKDNKDKLRKRLNLFYSNQSGYEYDINSTTFTYLNKFLDDDTFSEEEIKSTLSFNTYYFNKLDKINEYQVVFVIKLKKLNRDNRDLFKYISLINTQEDVNFFELIINKFLNEHSLKSIIEKYIYKQLPEYMLESRGNEGCYYSQFLRLKGGRWDFNGIPKDFHRPEVYRLIYKIGMKEYIELYERNEKELKEYLNFDFEKNDKEILKLEKLISN